MTHQRGSGSTGAGVRRGIRIRDGLIIGREARDRAMNRLAAGPQTNDVSMATDLNSDPFTLFGPRPWFRLCAAVPALRRMTFKGSWAKVTRPRSWELAS
jgi:hypothetical protein